MRRTLDLFLIVLILAAVGVGAYTLGRKVDHESSRLASQDAELNQTTNAVRTTKSHSNHTVVYVAIGVGGVAAALFVGSMASALLRSRRRARWHAT